MRRRSTVYSARNGLETVFTPSTVAIVGASDGNLFARVLFENLSPRWGDRLFLVNPRRDELWERPCFRDLSAVPERVDLALVTLNEDASVGVLEAGRAHGLRSAILFAHSLGSGPAAEERARRIRALCAGDDGLRVIGPNTMGTAAFHPGTISYAHRQMRTVPAGGVALASASGGAVHVWCLQAAARGLGLSYAVSVGNEVDVDLTDYVDFFVDDPDTKVICAIVEGIRRPVVFARAAVRALAAKKPILVLKLGRSPAGTRSVMSHTGALAGSQIAFSAFCRRYGIIECPSLDDLIETALVFTSGRIPTGSRVGMVGHSGGNKSLFLDAAHDEGLQFGVLDPKTSQRIAELEPEAEPENPLDGNRVAVDTERYQAVCRALAEDPNVDILAVQGRLPDTGGGSHPATMFAELAAATAKPVVGFERMAYGVTDAGRRYQTAAGVSFLQGIPRTVHALKALGGYGARVKLRPPVVPDPATFQHAAACDDQLVRASLRRNGVLAPRERVVQTPGEAAAAAGEIGFPVALKLRSSQIVHKTEFGAVRLGLTDAAAVRAAAEQLVTDISATHPHISIDGFLVQETVSGLEILVGARTDEQFGPLIVVGLGGVQAEVLRDTATRLLPLEPDDVEEMLGSLRAAALLDRFRGQPARDRAALVRAVLGVASTFLEFLGPLSDLEINPLIVREAGSGAVAVDVRAIIA